MVYLITALFLSVKSVVYVRSRVRLSFAKWLCFATLWVGMNPVTILFKRLEHHLPFRVLKIALTNIVIGLSLLYLVHRLMVFPNFYYPVWLLSLVGFSMIFHFGLINIMVFCWQIAGIKVMPPFRSPLSSKTLSDFWSKDWNYAFVEMNTIAVYRPVRRYVGASGALMFTFFVSGIFHEIAISLPVDAGFGEPLTYFALQGVLVVLENRIVVKFPQKMKAYGRLYLFLSLLAPLPLLFPPDFVHSILFFIVNAIF